MLENPVAKRTAIAAAIGAVVAIPLPFIGPIVGALVGGGFSRHGDAPCRCGRPIWARRLSRRARASITTYIRAAIASGPM